VGTINLSVIVSSTAILYEGEETLSEKYNCKVSASKNTFCR
jgi:hypothetical protein